MAIWDGLKTRFLAAITNTVAAEHEDAATGQVGFSDEFGEQMFLAGVGVYRTTSDPDANDDSNDGFSTGVMWVNISTGAVFICSVATVGAAVWVPITTVVGSDYVRLASVIASGNTYIELDLSALSAGDYVAYEVRFDKVQPLTDGHHLYVQGYINGAYRTDAFYFFVEQAENTAGVGSYTGVGGQNASLVCAFIGTNTGWNSTTKQEHARGTMLFGDLLNTIYVQGYDAHSLVFSQDDNARGANFYGGYHGSNATAWAKLRFFTSNVATSAVTNGVVTGEFHLYGIKGA